MSSIDHLAIGMVNLESVRLSAAFAGRAIRAVGPKPKTKTRQTLQMAGDSGATPLSTLALPNPLPAGDYVLTVGYEDEPDDATFNFTVA